MLNKKELEYVRQAITTIQCLDSETNLHSKWDEWLREREILSEEVLKKIDSLKNITTIEKKDLSEY